MPAFTFIGDVNGDGPERLSLFGHNFDLCGGAVEVEGESIIAKLRGNSHFREEKPAKAAKVEAPPPLPPPPAVSESGPWNDPGASDKSDPRASKVGGKGRAAAEAGKKRSVPVAYRGKPEEALWLAGFDSAAE